MLVKSAPSPMKSLTTHGRDGSGVGASGDMAALMRWSIVPETREVVSCSY